MARDLLPELCGLVADRLDGFSVLTFPAVCKSWSTAYTEVPGLRSGFPTMLTSGLDRTSNAYTVYDYEEGVFALHDVSSAKSFPAAADGLMCRCWVGGKDDWLSSPPTPTAKSSSSTLSIMAAPCRRLPCPLSTPSMESKWTAGNSVSGWNTKCTLKSFSGSRSANPEPEVERAIRYADTIVHGEKVVAVSQTGGVYSWTTMDDKTAAADPTVLREPEAMSIRRKIYDGQPQGTFRASDVGLYELDDTSSKSTWRPVSDIGSDCALFLGANYPFYITVPSGSRGSKHLKPNCIYVADMASSDAAVIDLTMAVEDNFRCLDYLAESDAFQMPTRMAYFVCLIEFYLYFIHP
ncbi:hypothetical protein QOZ80_4BG0332090 [Eleusine coracana subsp. coracana]|nr:hypothetical protein QOZ80_4BG0332090 [Eleusine coracana subsp. coracana]